MNSEIAFADYIRYVEGAIPGSGGAPITLRAVFESALTDEEKARIVQVVIRDHGASFLVGEETDLSGKNETILAADVYTEPCLGGLAAYLDKTYVRAAGAGALTPLVKVYIGSAPNIMPLT